MPDTAIPSIDSLVSANLPNPVIPEGLTVKTVEPTEAAKPEAAKSAPKAETPKPTTFSESLTAADDTPPVPEKKAEVATEEPRKGEKPAAFIERLKAERADLANQLKQAKEQSSKREADPAELAELRRELAERDRELETSAFERSRKFKDTIAAPLEKAVTAAKETVNKFTETKGVYERALAMDVKDREAYLSEEMGAAAAALAMVKIDRVEELAAAKDAALANAAEISKTVAAERAASEDREVLAAFDSQLESIAKRLSVYRGDNAQALAAQARSLIDGTAAPQDIIQAAYLAAAAPAYISMVKTLQAELATYKARDAEREGDRATVGARGGEGRATAPGAIVDGKLPTLDDLIKSTLAASQRAA